MAARFAPAVRFLALAALFGAAAPAIAQVAAPALRAGDTWTYQAINNYNRLPIGTWTREVVAAGPTIRVESRADGRVPSEAVFTAPGVLESGVLSDTARGSMQPALQLMPFPLAEGQSWSQKVVRTDPVTRQPREMLLRGWVKGWETVKVPAGEFKALKVERTIFLGDYTEFVGRTERTETEWYVPELRGPAKVVVFEEFCERRYSCGWVYQPGVRETYVLTAFKPG
jgi:hypothetical protein